MKKLLVSMMVLGVMAAVAISVQPTNAVAPAGVDIYGNTLRDGDVISANQSAGDPDIYIIGFIGRPHTGDTLGYKRLFLNPAIFSMYAHLGGFANVRQVTAQVRDSFTTSGLFRNCETNDQKVWATEITGEDSSVLHHVQMTGEQASAEDYYFFGKVFCINTREENSYVKSITPYYRLADIPTYFRRACRVRPDCLDAVDNRCLLPEPIEGWCPVPTPKPPLTCAPEGASPENPSLGPDQPYNGTCCAGLEKVSYPNPTRLVGTAPYRCVRPGCYYQQVYCADIAAPCPPVLVCPSPSPVPLSCNRVCSSNADCTDGLTCYQPPFYCPSGQYCAQVMPAMVCRNASNPTNTSCQR